MLCWISAAMRAQLKAVVMLAPHRQSEDRDIIDGTSLDQRLRHSRRHAIEIRVKLAVDLDQGIFLRRADQEAYDHQALPWRRRRVHILDPGDLMHQILDRQRDTLLHFGGRCARHRGSDVQHRNEDLRLFFAGNDRDREDSQMPAMPQ